MDNFSNKLILCEKLGHCELIEYAMNKVFQKNNLI